MSVSLAVYQDSGVAQRSEDIAKNPTDEIIQNQAACCMSCMWKKTHYLTPNLQCICNALAWSDRLPFAIYRIQLLQYVEH